MPANYLLDILSGTNAINPNRGRPSPLPLVGNQFEALTPLMSMLGAGQMLTQEGRPINLNKNKDFVTERTITVTHPSINQGQATNIPSVYNGEIVNEQQAVANVIRNQGFDPITGRKLEGFPSIDEAVFSAQNRSHGLGDLLVHLMGAVGERNEGFK